MNNFDEKIITIKDNQKRLLELVKSKIQAENEVFNLNTKNIVDVLNYDTKMVKKYEAVTKAQQLIEEYTLAIKNATTIDEIVEIRKKLNSCINKVKKAMRDRGFDDYEYNKYTEEVNKLRKGISENIRYLKRENKINEIERLNNNFDSLTDEEKNELKRLVKNELSYEKKNLGNYNIDTTDNTKLTVQENLDKVLPQKNDNDNQDLQEKIDKLFPKKEENNEIKENDSNEIKDSLLRTSINRITNFKSYDSLHDFLDETVNAYDGRYRISKTIDFSKNVIKNISIFTKNLPKYIKNKSKVKLVVRDYEIFSRKPELLGYGHYICKNNSILHNLGLIVSTPLLKNKEEYYANEHERCINWIIGFCENNDMDIKFNQTVKSV